MPICFYVLPQMVTLQCMWYSLFVESGKLSALCLLLLQGGCFCGPPSLVSCYTPLLCYNCVFIHNLQRVCWQQQLISHSCRGGDSNLILTRPLCSPKLCQCFPKLFKVSDSLQKPFLNLITCLFICQLRLGYL